MKIQNITISTNHDFHSEEIIQLIIQLFYLVLTLTSMCVSIVYSVHFVLYPKKKNHRQLTQVGFEPLTFAFLEQSLKHFLFNKHNKRY